MRTAEKIFLISFAFIAALLLIAPFFIPAQHLHRIDLPNAYCLPRDCGWFGRGENGIDLFLNTLAASQTAILLSIAVCTCSILIGVPLGMLSNLLHKNFDHVTTLITNLFLSFPSLLIAIALSSFIGQGFFSTWMILIISGWAPFTRLSRAASMQVMTQDYITAAESIGCSRLRTAFQHVFPNILPVIIVQAAFQLAGIIIVESTLSFLGLGISQSTPSLGRLIYMGKQVILSYPHAALIPGCFIFFLIVGFYVSGMILDQHVSRRSVAS